MDTKLWDFKTLEKQQIQKLKTSLELADEINFPIEEIVSLA